MIIFQELNLNHTKYVKAIKLLCTKVLDENISLKSLQKYLEICDKHQKTFETQLENIIKRDERTNPNIRTHCKTILKDFSCVVKTSDIIIRQHIDSTNEVNIIEDSTKNPKNNKCYKYNKYLLPGVCTLTLVGILSSFLLWYYIF